MARIDAILKLVKEQGASDLHLATGSPPMIRIQGEITAIPHQPLSREVRKDKVLARDAAPHLSYHELSGQLEKLEPASSRREAA